MHQASCYERQPQQHLPVILMFERASLSEQVEVALRQEITHGKLRPGQRINAADYKTNWNVSSTPFRDAIRALQIQGFVTVEPRKGVYVAPVNVTTLQEIFELRIAFECIAIELATAHVPQQEALSVRGAYLDARDHLEAGDTSLLAKRDRLVHELAENHCGNSRLQQLLSAHTDLFHWAQNTIIRELPKSYELALPEHIQIMDAVCDRDAAGAAAAMRSHLENSHERLARRLESAPEKNLK